MNMADVKVGMNLKSTLPYGYDSPLIVTEITEKGFKYICEARTLKIGLFNGMPEFGTMTGGECYAIDNEVFYEEIEQNQYTI